MNGAEMNDDAEQVRRAPRKREVATSPVLGLEALSYHRFSPRNLDSADIPLIDEAYRCWSEVWKATLSELDNLPDVPSDEFTRQDEVGALFHGNECIGLTCFRWVDASRALFQDDSYFKVWPKETILAVRELGLRLCILSNLTVAPHWRRATGGSVMEVLGGLSVDRFLGSDRNVVVATPRSDRGVNRLCYRLGFRALARDIIHHGVKIDLVAFDGRARERRYLAMQTEDIVAKLQTETVPSP
jgi:hypothetical protein